MPGVLLNRMPNGIWKREQKKWRRKQKINSSTRRITINYSTGRDGGDPISVEGGGGGHGGGGDPLGGGGDAGGGAGGRGHVAAGARGGGHGGWRRRGAHRG